VVHVKYACTDHGNSKMVGTQSEAICLTLGVSSSFRVVVIKQRCTEVCFRSERCLLISTKVRQKIILRVTTLGTKDADSFFKSDLCNPPASTFFSAVFPTPT